MSYLERETSGKGRCPHRGDGPPSRLICADCAAAAIAHLQAERNEITRNALRDITEVSRQRDAAQAELAEARADSEYLSGVNSRLLDLANKWQNEALAAESREQEMREALKTENKP